ncbi:Bifunctional NAD(P)H-hydrate repair enzyme Nnr [uncultured bacterium]|nr:Bifunctional NAD(P)H-hydrate repair enzyme Nnr [uncultured bacterium]
MKIADANAIRAIDRAAVEKYGISGLQLMENAGRGAADVILRQLGGAGKAAVLCGKGNNGGDGYVIARHLHNSGVEPTVYTLCKTGELRGDAAANAATWSKMGGETVELLSIDAVKSASAQVGKADVIVDAIFGTGLSEEAAGHYAEAIRLVNGLGRKVVSVDIPSGIDATTGAVLGEAVKAHVTATMAMPKLGLLLYPGRAHAGAVEVVDIGVPKEAVEDPSVKWNLLGPSDMTAILRPRQAESHKSSHGHLFVIGASPGMTGAVYMAGTAALRAGAGLVTAGVPESLNAILEVKTTEVMTAGLPETGRRLGASAYEEVRRLAANKTALVVGPGAGTSEELMKLIGLILDESNIPVVIDADGLNSFAPRIASLKEKKAQVVLTPPPGEASRLLNVKVQAIQADRVGAAEKLAGMTGATVVLKGAYTVIACPGGQVFLNPTGNPGLATAGTGDILAGMLGAFLAQGYTPFEASAAAVYIHGLAGDEAKKKAGELGMIATDRLEFIPPLLTSFTGTRY